MTFTGLQTAMVLIGDYEEKRSFVEYDADGRIIFDDNSCRELDLSDSDTAF